MCQENALKKVLKFSLLFFSDGGVGCYVLLCSVDMRLATVG